MLWLSEAVDDVRIFLETGGTTMNVIFMAALVMWVVTLERYWFLWFELPKHLQKARQTVTDAVARRDPWLRAYRDRAVSEVRLTAQDRIWMVRTMVAVCPLLGLLGTVLGMLEVFDVMSISGNSNPRAMAAGVSQATITTLAGMATALSGLFFVERLQRRTQSLVRRFADQMSEVSESGHGEEERNGQA
ncbi:MAG: MotA/TolQ/ExbB proton channel family protein [Myxococcota bacterium]